MKRLLTFANVLGAATIIIALSLYLPEPKALAQAVNHYVAATFHPSATAAGLAVECTTLPSSPSNGAVACDSADSNQVKVRSNGAWVTVGSGSSATAGAGILNTSGTWSWNPLDATIVQIREEFNGGPLTNFGYSGLDVQFYNNPITGSSTLTGVAPSDPNTVGIVQLNTAASASSAFSMWGGLPATGVNPFPVANSGTWKATQRFKLGQASGNQTFMIGWDSANSAPGTASSLYIEGTGADTNFFFKNCNATTCSSRVDSGVAIDTNWHVLTTGRDGSNMYICLDACSSPTTISTNIPATAMAPKFYLKTGDSTVMTMQVDYFRYMRTAVTAY